ncbi:MAG: carboxypeptidase-like regulatory domain-containing protein, partial [Planctomycetota bacterium JB042]
MKKPLLLGGAAVVLAAVVALILSGDGPDAASLPASDPAEPGVAEGPSGPAPARASRESAVSEGLEEAAPAEEPAPEGPPESYTRALGGLIGRVVERDGSPMPEMAVELLAATLDDFLPDVGSMFGEEPPRFEAVKDRTETDEEGRFRFTGMDPRGFYVLGIDLGGARATIRFVDRVPNAGEVVDLGDVVLDPYVTFTGRVVDERRNPVAGARVRATNLPSILFTFGLQEIRPDFHVAFQEDLGSKWRVAPIPRFVPKLIERFPIPSTRTGEDGAFTLEGVPLGMATVLIDKEGLVSLVHGPVPTGESGSRDLGTLVLRAGEELIGRVVDPSDEPIANATVLAGARLELAPAAVLAPVAVTDEDGRFVARGLRDVDHVVAARPEGAIDWTLVTDVVPGFDEPEIVIGDTHRVVVSAFAATGAPLPRPAIVVQPINRLPLHPLIVPPISLSKRLSYTEDG